MWHDGDLVRHRFNSDLGVGRVTEVRHRRLKIDFPEVEESFEMTLDGNALERVVLPPGSSVLLLNDGSRGRVEQALDDGQSYQLDDGRVIDVADLWPSDVRETPIDRLKRGELGSAADFANRLAALRLDRLRRADDLSSFLGGRIRLYAHQLYVAERATRADPVRWLLADEVGLGKTVEACLILNHLVHTGRAERVLVVAPDTLTVQWLGELYRKYHQVFVLLDDARLKDVARDHGPGFNPFDAHPHAVISLEMLAERPRLSEQAVESGLDLIVVDEAHHLERPEGTPGNPAYRVVAPMVLASAHALLLTATPLEEDPHAFFVLLQLLLPDFFADGLDVDAILAGTLPPCTSATRRADIGGFPPRIGQPVDLERSPNGIRMETALNESAASNAALEGRKLEAYQRLLSSPAACPAPTGVERARWKEWAEVASEEDPRLAWLLEQAPRYREAGEKTLVFVAYKETLDWVREAFERKLGRRVGVFHEDLAPQRRDIEVAQFREAAGPSVLLSTECGGEGRNFEFCTRIVLFDLPWSTTSLEQRIGRLDRIGRQGPVEIVYFRFADGLGGLLARVAEETGIFAEPLGGLSRELGGIERVLSKVALEPEPGAVGLAPFEEALEAATEARERIEEAAYHTLHADPYQRSMEDALLARVPSELDDRARELVLGSVERLGFDVLREPGEQCYSIELGSNALVDHVPGVPGGRRFLGSFDREEAVARESIDFFASGHPLTEGLLQELEDSARGRAVALSLALPTAVRARAQAPAGWGCMAIYEGSQPRIEVRDAAGQRRAEWEAALLDGGALMAKAEPDRAPRLSGAEELEELLGSLSDDPSAVAIFYLV